MFFSALQNKVKYQCELQGCEEKGRGYRLRQKNRHLKFPIFSHKWKQHLSEHFNLQKTAVLLAQESLCSKDHTMHFSWKSPAWVALFNRDHACSVTSVTVYFLPHIAQQSYKCLHLCKYWMIPGRSHWKCSIVNTFKPLFFCCYFK